MRNVQIVSTVEVAVEALAHFVSRMRRRRRFVVAFTVALVGVPAMAGCGSTATPTPSISPAASPSPSPSPSIDPKVAAAKAKALAAYKGYVHAYAAAATKANPDDPNLTRFIGGALLSLSQHDLRILMEHGAVELGHPKATVRSSTVDLTASPPTVTIESCMDYSDYRLVYKSNQSPVPNGALEVSRYTSTATVSLFVGGQWLVSGDLPYRDTPC